MPDQGSLGVILAGGSARRMGGGDKGLVAFAGRPLLAHVIERIAPQVDLLVLNAIGDPARFSATRLDVIADHVADQGPLGGVLAGLDHAAEQGFGQVVTVASDMPFLPLDLAERLSAASPFAMAEAGKRLHPVCAFWPVSIRDKLRADLARGTRRVADWALENGAVTVSFDDPTGFFNVNTPEDLIKAERIRAAHRA